MAPQPVDVLFYTPLDVVLLPVADFFFDPGDFQVSIRSVLRVAPGLKLTCASGTAAFSASINPPYVIGDSLPML